MALAGTYIGADGLSDRSTDFLGESDANLLRASAERLRPIWEAPDGEVRPLHGWGT